MIKLQMANLSLSYRHPRISRIDWA